MVASSNSHEVTTKHTNIRKLKMIEFNIFQETFACLLKIEYDTTLYINTDLRYLYITLIQAGQVSINSMVS